MIPKRSAAAALDKARADLAALAVAIAELQQRRDAELAGDGDIDAVAAIDREADEQGRRLRASQDKIALLESRLASEQAAQCEVDYKAAVAKIEGPLARRSKAAVALEKDFTPANARRFVAANNAVLESWSAEVEWPSRVFHPAYLSVERLARRVQEALEPARGHADRRPRTPGEYLTRFLKADLAGFGADEAEQARALLDDLRHAHDDPAPAETEEEAA